MPFGTTLAFVAATTFASAPPAGDRTDADRPRGPVISKQVHDDWMFSVEAATHVPVDVGVQAGVEMPFGLRIFGGYGWVPRGFVDAITSLTNSNSRVVQTILDTADYSGHSARVTLGLRPFRHFGGYFDAGYAHLRLDGSQAVPGVSFDGYSFSGGTYNLSSAIDIWLVELGYQGEIGGRLVLAGGIGLMGAIDARTRITPSAGSPNYSELGNVSSEIDHTLQTHVLPTLTVRIGFDLI